MKTTITFDFDEDHDRLMIFQQADVMYDVLRELDQKLRGAIKHNDNSVEVQFAQHWRDVLTGLLEENEVVL